MILAIVKNKPRICSPVTVLSLMAAACIILFLLSATKPLQYVPYPQQDVIPREEEQMYKVAQDMVLSRKMKVNNNFTKVIIMAQARGGSTFASSLFFSNPEAVFWFEPEYGFYVAMYGYIPIDSCHPDEIQFKLDGSLRAPTEYEQLGLTTLTTKILNNYLEDLPEGVWNSPFMTWFKDNEFSDLYKCTQMTVVKERLYKKCGKMKQLADYIKCYNLDKSESQKLLVETAKCVNFDSYVNCRTSIRKKIPTVCTKCSSLIKNVQQKYSKRKIVAIKMHRLRISNLASILQADPSVKVIHYVRDPRGILASRKKVSTGDMTPPRWAEGSWRLYAAGLCSRMMDDIRTIKKLETKYPNTFLTLKYEDLVKEPEKYAKDVYKFIGHDLPQKVVSSMQKNTHKSGLKREDMYTPVRRNGTSTAYAWQKYWSDTDKDAITVVCYKLLRELHYDV